MSNLDSQTQTRRRARFDWPDLHRLLDLAFVVVLTSLALSGFASSYTGGGYLVVGIVGTVLGALIATAFRALRWPVVASVLALVLVFFLFGGPLCLRSIGDTAYVPGGGTLSELTDQVLFGWKDMLTTLPPVDGTGPLLVLPWTLGLASGFIGALLVHVRTGRSWLTALLPVLACALSLVVVIGLGVRHPQSLWLQGVGFAAVALGWLAVRGRRESAAVRGGSRGVGRGLVGLVMLAGAAVLALPVANAAMDADADRTVLRSYVEPPFDIGRYPSLLASFRNYVELPATAVDERPTNVYEKELFRVSGAPAGTRVRFATLDRYDGLVWGASNDALPDEAEDSYQRVSSVIDNPIEGDPVKATVTLGEGYRGVWLPVIGALRSMEFESGDATVKADSFRYNLATSTAVVPSGLHPGDRYSFTAVAPDDTVSADDVPSSQTSTPAEGTGFLDGPSSKWTEEATTPMERVFAVAEHLKTEGRYSDGVKKSERTYYPGHGIQRLSDGFVNAEVMVGNDEQYAATMALMANKIGVPARVVMGAVVPEGGVVTGKDVSAWVELRLADGSWRTLPTEDVHVRPAALGAAAPDPGAARRRRTRCLPRGRRYRRRARRRERRSEVRCSRQACAATTHGQRGRPRLRRGSRSESAAASRRARTGTPGCRGWRSAVRRPRVSVPRRLAASSTSTTSGSGCWGRTCPRRCAGRYPRFRDTCLDLRGGTCVCAGQEVSLSRCD